MGRRLLLALAAGLSGPALLGAADSFVHFESPHVHPLDVTPPGARLLAVNTADNRLEVFALGAGPAPAPAWLESIPVGLEPVSVRARSDAEAWVVNHVSDSVSVVDLAAGRVVATLGTDDEPADVVFAGSPERAFVSCSQANTLLVFDPQNLAAPPVRIPLEGEDPRALAVAADGATVYAAIFESGNGTTLLGGGGGEGATTTFPPNVVSNKTGPYAGQNPPPNAGAAFAPPFNAALDRMPEVGLIVRKDAQGRWRDDNATDWTPFVSGAQAALSGRPQGWDLLDHDVAVVDAATLGVSYLDRLMNLCMALVVHPDGRVFVVGTEATNEIRFEANLTGTFVRVNVAVCDVQSGAAAVKDLNPHLGYQQPNVSQAVRDLSLGDPRGIAFEPAGARGYVAGMGSNNVIVIDGTGSRVAAQATIEVGEGPTGVVHHPSLPALYVLNRFDGSVSAIHTTTRTEVARVPFFDPTPPAVALGRRHLFDTHATSGLGQASCASCHVDARMDRLAWDLGDPSGEMQGQDGQNVGGTLNANPQLAPWHPMKGPMTTQTLVDIIGKEPLHWRGDRPGIEAFNGAFVGLQGDDAGLDAKSMQEFEDYLATLHFPPNPFRAFDNSLPEDLPLPGFVSTGRFSPPGTPMPDGDAQKGLDLYRAPGHFVVPEFSCASCHTLPVGMGSALTLNGGVVVPTVNGPLGEAHHALVSLQNSQVPIKIPQLRNLYEKTGFDLGATTARAGFGFLHDGASDTLVRFLSEPQFHLSSDKQIANVIAFLLSFSGSDLPKGSLTSALEPLGPDSRDAHAAVGRQTTVVSGAAIAPAQRLLIEAMVELADERTVGLVVKGRQDGAARGYAYVGKGTFKSDRLAERPKVKELLAAASPGSELTWTLVPFGSEDRIGVDRDLDGALDRDETETGFDAADPELSPACGAAIDYGAGCAGSGGFVPQLSVAGCLTAGGFVRLEISRGLGKTPAILVLGEQPAAVPAGGGCTLLAAPLAPFFVGPFLLEGAGPGKGNALIEGYVPQGQAPMQVSLQAWMLDAANPNLGLTASNGVELIVQ